MCSVTLLCGLALKTTHDFDRNPYPGAGYTDINGVRSAWQKVVDKMSGNLASLTKARKITYIEGRGKFT